MSPEVTADYSMTFSAITRHELSHKLIHLTSYIKVVNVLSFAILSTAYAPFFEPLVSLLPAVEVRERLRERCMRKRGRVQREI